MFNLIGCLLSTSLYSIIIFVLGWLLKGKFDVNSIVFYMALSYPVLLAIDHILLKIKYIKNRKIGFPDDYSFFPDIFKTIFYNLINPFRHIWMFLLIISKKHIIQDDSKLHNFYDFMWVLFDFIFSILIIIIAVIYLI